MSININRVILGGRITKDPEIKYTNGKGENGQPIAVMRFSLAIKQKFNRDVTDFIPCVAFGKTAEFIGKYFKQGDCMVVYGKIQPGSYVNSEGKKVYTYDVTVNEADFAESKRSDQSQSDNQNVQNQPNSNLSQFPTQQPKSNPNTQHQPGSNQNQAAQSVNDQYRKDKWMPFPEGVPNQEPRARQQAGAIQSQSKSQAAPKQNVSNQNGTQAAPNQPSANSYPENDYYSNMALDNGYFDDASFDLGLQ